MYSRFSPSFTFINTLESKKPAVHVAEVTISAGLRKRKRDDFRTFRNGRKRSCKGYYWAFFDRFNDGKRAELADRVKHGGCAND